jgi:Dynamin family.
MKKVFIKYNPYKLETEVRVEEKEIAQNSRLREKITEPDSRLQDWVEELPKILIEEYNDTDFDILFHGTLLDYEDLTDVFTAAFERGELTVKLDRIPAKEVSDKEEKIDHVFEKIQQGPFDELRDKDIVSAFQNAKSSDFEICVVATMSAGKSTLINSMLGTKLMPSKQEACTAIITRIKDMPNSTAWQAEVYDKAHKLIESHEELTYSTMERLNGDKKVSVIKVNGKIPFVSSEDVSLVLIDTPGPNNSRDTEHKEVQDEFLNGSSKSLVLYIMEGTFGSDDDNTLLDRVAKSMKVGGKQSKDRFIFVVNKMDARKKEDGDTAQMLERVRKYLEDHDIKNPNLFPAAALPALDIRLISNGAEVDEYTLEDTEYEVRKLNRSENFYFENYASLPASIRGKINEQLSEAKKAGNVNEQALIHTGIVSIEAAIRQYVQKYAKTAKIKNIVDTFNKKVEELGDVEKLKRELAVNVGKSNEIAENIAKIRKNVDDVNTAKKFKDAVDDAVVQVNEDARDVIEGIVQKYQAKISKRIDDLRGDELDVDEAEDEVARLEKFAKKLEPDFQNELDDLIKDKLIGTSNALLKEYKKKLASLTEEIDLNGLTGISIDPLKLMGGSITTADDFSVRKLVQSKQVEDGKEWVENTDKKWWKPWTWFQEKGHYRTKYKTVKYIDAMTLAEEFLIPIKDIVYDNGENARTYTVKQSNHIAKLFEKEFKRLDDVLKEKLFELENYATDKEKAEERVKESEYKIKWLEEIKSEVKSILEI